jgi:hypothetical protein
LISVTSPNKLSTRTYVVTLYVLMDDQVTPTLSDLVLDHGELDPEFIPESFKYTVFHDNDRNRVGLRQGLTLVHFSPQTELFLTQNNT